VVYAFIAGTVNFAEGNLGVFKSSNFGKTWNKIADYSTPGAGVSNNYWGYTQMLGVHPSDTNRIILGAQSAAFSTDGGKTFNYLNTGHADNHVYAQLDDPDAFLVGNDGGIFKCFWNNPVFDATQNMNRDFVATQYYAGDAAPNGPEVLGGTQDNGTFFIQNGAIKSVGGGDGGPTFIGKQRNWNYISTQWGVVFRYKPDDAFGLYGITPKTSDEYRDFINAYEINPADDRQLYYRTSAGLWRTTDAGETWSKLNQGKLFGIQSIAVSEESDPSVYIGGSNCFYRFNKAATSATPAFATDLRASIPFPVHLYWGNIGFLPSDKNTLLFGLTSMEPAARVWRVEKAHTTNPQWKNLTGDLPDDLPVYQVQAHPDRPDQVYFAATMFGLYYTVDGGKTWTKETRVPNVAISQMKMRVSDRTLFLFTYGRGVWQLKMKNLSTPTPVEEPGQAPKLTLWPNPVRDILYLATENEIKTVQVFDAQGRAAMAAQSGDKQLDMRALPAGMYTVRVVDGKGRAVVRQVVKQ
jgi:Secretion system C-terminal sorting domain/BNR/Asp-box repeat